MDEIKEKELKTLKKELKEEEDPERKEQIKYLIQRQVIHSVEKTKIYSRKKIREINSLIYSGKVNYTEFFAKKHNVEKFY